MATQFSILAKVKVDTADIQRQLDNLKDNTIQLHADTQDFEMSISVANAVMREFVELAENMVEQVYALDSSLTEFKKVSELRGAGLDEYVEQLGELGNTVARTTSDMVDAATMFRKSGFSDAESAQLAQLASMYQNIADTQVSGEKAAASIVSQIQAFGRGMIEPMHIIDAYNETANNFAVGTGDLSRAMELSAAGMATYGNSFEEVIGLIVSGSEIMQGRSAQVARGLNTISANIVEQSDLLAQYGITVVQANGDLTSTYDVLKQLKPVWDELTDAERQSLGQALAGKNQYRVLAAVMQNFQHAVEATETAVNSTGSAMRENTAYMESLESKTTLLKATFQTLANDVIPKELIAKGLDVLDKFLKLLDTDLGVVLTRITLLTGIGWGFSSLVSASKILPTIISQFSNFTKLLTGATIVIPEAAAATGGLTAAMATFQAVALPIIGIIATLGTVIGLIIEKEIKNKKAIDEMSSSAVKFKESIDGLNKNMTEEKSKIDATVTSVDIYLKRIEELDKKLILNNAEQAEYHSLLQKIVEVMPSVASSIDLQNDKIIGGTTAIYDQIEAWKKLAEQQAYQATMTDLYKNKADMQLQLAEQKLKLAQKEAEYANLPATDVAIYGFWTQWTNPNEKKRKNLAQDISNTQTAIANLEFQLQNAESQIANTEEALRSMFDIPSTNSGGYRFGGERDRTPTGVGKPIGRNGSSTLNGENSSSNLSDWYDLKIIGDTISAEEEQINDSLATTGGVISSIEESTEEIVFNLQDFISLSESKIGLLESEYNLMNLQGESEENLKDKIKEIQAELHNEAEILRNVLQNSENLELTTEEIYSIQSNINELGIEWWNWQNKIKKDSEETLENYEEIEESIDNIKEAQIAELNQEKDAISALSSSMVDYYDKQISEIDNQIQALKDSNTEIEEQIALQEKLDAVARARQNKLYVYKDGRFQFIEDADAVSSATKDLASYKRKQQLEDEIAGLEAEKQALDNMKSSWSNMVQDYEKEQDRWLISQSLGIDTALKGWERLVSGAETYAERYKQIISEIADLEAGGKNTSEYPEVKVGDDSKTYDPNVDYSALMLQSTSLDEVNHWASKREEKIKGEGLVPEKSTQEFFNEWEANHKDSYANGTFGAKGGLSLVGEHGAELRLLNRGDGIIPANMTANLMSWGSMTPNQFKMSSFGGIRNGMNVTIQALNLPNVSDGASFVDYVRNNMFGQVLSFVH